MKKREKERCKTDGIHHFLRPRNERAVCTIEHTKQLMMLFNEVLCKVKWRSFSIDI